MGPLQDVRPLGDMNVTQIYVEMQKQHIMAYFGGEFQALKVAAVSINANILLCYLQT